MFKNNFLWVLLLAVLVVWNPLYAQVEPDSIIQNQVELLVSRSDAENDFAEFAEDYQWLLNNPVNINSRSLRELGRLFFLSKPQQYRILAYTSTYGDMVSEYELAQIEGIDSSTLSLIKPYIVIKPSSRDSLRFSNVFKYGRNQLLVRYQSILQDQLGYTPASDSLLSANPDARYLGDASRIYFRYGFDYKGRIRFGVLGDKDPGEAFFKGSQPNGFDFYSAYAWASNTGFIKQMVVGDYHLSFGQGLTLWSGLSFGKSGYGLGFAHQARGIRPNTSANEAMFMRGAALTTGFGDFEATAFASSLPIDASVHNSDSADGLFRSLDITGLHRTPSEVAGKGNLTVTSFGGNVSLTKSIFALGITAVATKFSGEFLPTGSLYQLFQTQQSKELAVGINGKLYLRKTEFAGEFTRDRNGCLAALMSGVFQLDPRFLMTLVYRNYDKSFKNFYANSFGENSQNANEEGLFIGIRSNPGRRLEVFTYADFYRFPWLKYRVDAPSTGQEFFAQAIYNLKRSTQLTLRYRFETKPLNVSNSQNLATEVGTVNYHNFRVQLQYQPVPSLTLANRIEMVLYKHASSAQEQGVALLQDVTWKPDFLPLAFTARYALFSTDGYNSRIYTYERDVLYSFSVPALYDHGSRAYLLVKFRKENWPDISMRWGTTVFSQVQVIGSGLDQIDGNSKTELKVQVLYKF